jgi:hypothetical protein
LGFGYNNLLHHRQERAIFGHHIVLVDAISGDPVLFARQRIVVSKRSARLLTTLTAVCVAAP